MTISEQQLFILINTLHDTFKIADNVGLFTHGIELRKQLYLDIVNNQLSQETVEIVNETKNVSQEIVEIVKNETKKA